MKNERYGIEFKRFDYEPTKIFKGRIIFNLALRRWDRKYIIEVLKLISDNTMVVILNPDRS
jgi:hypothetical protein